jgi:pimeloyl-ACP methyl ester carboxylesterase
MREQLTPTSAVRTTLPCATGPLAALDADPRLAGRPPVGTLLLLPGYTGSKEDFAPILDPLCANGFRALAVDLPGQFESPGPDDEDSYAPLTLGRVIAGMVDHLAANGGPLVLLGHSFGGLVARGVVLAGATVTGLVLLDSGPGAFRFGQRYAALRAGAPILRRDGRAVVYDRTVATARAERKTVPPDVAALLRRRFVESNQSALLGMGHALQHEPDRVDDLRRALSVTKTPVAVIAGRDDDAWPVPDQHEMAVRLGTDLAIIDGAAHSPAVENPAALLAVLVPLLESWTRPTAPEA